MQVSSATVTEACPNYTFCTSDVIVCSKCSTQLSKGQCPSWAASNDLAPDDIPTQLASLSLDEVRTISLVCPFLKVILLPGGQFGEEGSVIHFPFPLQHVQHVMYQLPRPLVESELILTAVGPGQREAFQNLLQHLDHQRIHRALIWLRGNNPLYSAIPMPNEPQTNQSDVLCTTVCVSGCLSDDNIYDPNSDDVN